MSKCKSAGTLHSFCCERTLRSSSRPSIHSKERLSSPDNSAWPPCQGRSVCSILQDLAFFHRLWEKYVTVVGEFARGSEGIGKTVGPCIQAHPSVGPSSPSLISPDKGIAVPRAKPERCKLINSPQRRHLPAYGISSSTMATKETAKKARALLCLRHELCCRAPAATLSVTCAHLSCSQAQGETLESSFSRKSVHGKRGTTPAQPPSASAPKVCVHS